MISCLHLGALLAMIFSLQALKLTIFLILVAVIFAVVPNTFGMSLVGLALSMAWLFAIARNGTTGRVQATESHLAMTDKYRRRVVLLLITWCLVVLSNGVASSYFRYVTPGYDLAWFAQAVTNAWNGRGLWVTFERPISHLVQHWEPILYAVAPLTSVFSGAVALAIWQSSALGIGTLGAWKLCERIFGTDSVLRAFACLTYVSAWIILNPFQFDVHPPVFGAVALFPWLFLFLVRNQKWRALAIILLLMQCGEIYFAVAMPYLAHILWRNKFPKVSFVLTFAIVLGGYLLLGAYQRYFGPWMTGDAFPFANRYGKIGGDGIGILKTAFTDPLLLLLQLANPDKLKTLAKVICYLGPFPFLAFRNSEQKHLKITVALGMLPYLIKVSLSGDRNMYHTATHYIAEFGPQWWLLFCMGLNHSKAWLPTLQHVYAVAACLFFVNSSEWRKSPMEIFRGVFDNRQSVRAEVRKILAGLDPDRSVAIFGAEWLCPLVVDGRKWVACEHVTKIKSALKFPQFSVVIGTRDSIGAVLQHSVSDLEKMSSDKILAAIANGTESEIGWQLKYQGTQMDRKYTKRQVMIWEPL